MKCRKVLIALVIVLTVTSQADARGFFTMPLAIGQTVGRMLHSVVVLFKDDPEQEEVKSERKFRAPPFASKYGNAATPQ
jgi:hypothetical protein